jgi:hypothetical protein
MGWYSFFNDFQTAIVGTLGFLGVMATLWQNASLARGVEEERIKSVKLSAKKAAIEELKFFKRIYENGIEGMRPDADQSLMVPRIKRVVTTDMMPEIALLDGQDAHVAIDALLTIDEIDRSLTLIATAVNEQYFTISAGAFETLQGMYSGRLDKLTGALQKLEQ